MGISKFPKVAIIIGLLIISATSLYFIPPVPQWDSYHKFSDDRPWFFINNFANVTSNIGLIVVGFYGLWKILNKAPLKYSIDLIPYSVFFLSIIFVGMGSAYYHWEPTTENLFWDRLPLSISFMSFFSAIVCDRINKMFGTFVILPTLILVAIYSLIYWKQTEMMGVGDLRMYGLVQYFPILAIPVILFLFPIHRLTPRGSVLWTLAWYVLAKFFEYFDSGVFNFLNNSLSGHTLKHMAATVAVIIILKMLINLRID